MARSSSFGSSFAAITRSPSIINHATISAVAAMSVETDLSVVFCGSAMLVLLCLVPLVVKHSVVDDLTVFVVVLVLLDAELFVVRVRSQHDVHCGKAGCHAIEHAQNGVTETLHLLACGPLCGLIPVRDQN